MTRIFGLRNCRDEQQGWNHGHLHNGRGRVAGSLVLILLMDKFVGLDMFVK